MSQTVSFVARDELAEWLKSRADEQMKSVSAVCQDIVAAEYRRQQAGKEESTPTESEPDGDALDRHPDAWYRPSGKHDYAVRDPSDSGNTQYYKTRDGAASRIRRWYEGEEGADGRR